MDKVLLVVAVVGGIAWWMHCGHPSAQAQPKHADAMGQVEHPTPAAPVQPNRHPRLRPIRPNNYRFSPTSESVPQSTESCAKVARGADDESACAATALGEGAGERARGGEAVAKRSVYRLADA